VLSMHHLSVSQRAQLTVLAELNQSRTMPARKVTKEKAQTTGNWFNRGPLSLIILLSNVRVEPALYNDTCNSNSTLYPAFPTLVLTVCKLRL